MSESKEVATKAETAVAIPKELLGSFVEDSGAGTENIGADDMKIPFLRIAQPLSPELNKKHENFIEGTEAGTIFNTVTRQLFGEEVNVIPCGYIKKYLEFIPREKGGGFQGEHAPNNQEVLTATRDKQTNKDIMTNGNELVVSAQHYCKFQDPETGGWQSAIIDMKSTNLKISRQWNTMIQMQEVKHKGKLVKLPSFGVIWTLRSEEASNEKGRWNQWKVSGRHGYVEDTDLYKDCRELSSMVSDGTVQASDDPDLDANTSDSGEAIPF